MKRRSLHKSIVALYFLLSFPVCSETHIARRTRTGGPDSPTWNEAALFLAGKTPLQDPRLAALSQRSEYKRYQSEIQRFWTGAAATQEALARFRDANNVPTAKRVLYPMSGADVLNAFAFYPTAREYVFLAREASGAPSVLFESDSGRMAAELDNILGAIAPLQKHNYFFTRTMKSRFHAADGGNAPVLMLFLALLGFHVDSVENVRITPNGTLVLDDPVAQAALTPVTRGVRIFFRPAAGGQERTLTYFSMPIEPGGMKTPGAASAFFNKFADEGDFGVFFKSAGYLLHEERFKDFCDYVADNASVVVQDDSGIPYSFFHPRRWQRRVYGRYKTPGLSIQDIGRPPFQQALAADFASQNPEPLRFDFGYGALAGPGASGLMVLVRTR
ncbi:MAG: hypothetical protein HY042_12855 [Spirochaetia bacterium]|nr:hypothetical protein [Spirochaetia bacterium]